MSAGLEKVLQAVAGYLSGRGVPAATAWPAGHRQEREEPVVLVSLRGCRVEPSGFQNYLGESFDQESGRWTERYGKKVRLTLGLDIYAPEKGGGDMVQSAFDALAAALLLEGPEGLDLLELSCGETALDGGSRRLRRPAQAVFSAFLWAGGDMEGGVFTDFELRGVVKQ